MNESRIVFGSKIQITESQFKAHPPVGTIGFIHKSTFHEDDNVKDCDGDYWMKTKDGDIYCLKEGVQKFKVLKYAPKKTE